MFYKSVVVECSTGTEDLAKAIEKKAEEMMKKGTYKLAAMSTVCLLYTSDAADE